MIEIDLLPRTEGKKKGAGARKGPSRSQLNLPRIPVDPWILAPVVLWVVVVSLGVWLFLGLGGRSSELAVELDVAQRDSTRFAEVIRRTESLQATRDALAERLTLLQELDGRRYLWPHLMDEVARALPDFTWLTRLSEASPHPELSFRIEGRSASYLALTSFMENLEASPFIRGVRLVGSDQMVLQVEGAGARRVYEFVLEARYETPPSDLIEREPLFGPSVAIPSSEID